MFVHLKVSDSVKFIVSKDATTVKDFQVWLCSRIILFKWTPSITVLLKLFCSAAYLKKVFFFYATPLMDSLET